jgi:hypothetical protein
MKMKLTNYSKVLQIVTLDDGSSIFMRSGQVTETNKKLHNTPKGVSVEEIPQKTPKPKEKEEQIEKKQDF